MGFLAQYTVNSTCEWGQDFQLQFRGGIQPFRNPSRSHTRHGPNVYNADHSNCDSPTLQRPRRHGGLYVHSTLMNGASLKVQHKWACDWKVTGWTCSCQNFESVETWKSSTCHSLISTCHWTSLLTATAPMELRLNWTSSSCECGV